MMNQTFDTLKVLRSGDDEAAYDALVETIANSFMDMETVYLAATRQEYRDRSATATGDVDVAVNNAIASAANSVLQRREKGTPEQQAKRRAHAAAGENWARGVVRKLEA